MSHKMFNVVLIDDEPHVIEGLKAMVPWESQGFVQVTAFEQSELALEHLLKNPPDLLITDVRMPILDGLDLIKKVKKVYPELYILIMSGYRDFEYVKKAITYGANGYLVKPVFEEDILPHLTEVKARIQKKEDELFCQRNCQLEEIKKYFNADESDKSIVDYRRGIETTELISPDHFETDIDTLQQNYRSINANRKRSFVALWKGNCASSTAMLLEDLEYILELIRMDEQEYIRSVEISEDLSIEISELYASAHGIIGWIPFDAKKVEKWLTMHTIAEQWNVIEADTDIEVARETFLTLKRRLERAHHYQKESFVSKRQTTECNMESFVDSILRLEEEQIREMTIELMHHYDLEQFSTREVIKSMTGLIEKIIVSMTRFIDEDEPLKAMVGELICFEKATVEDILIFFEKSTQYLLELTQKNRNLNKDSFKNQVENFVELHYNEPITIKELAEAMHMHPSYLGQKLVLHLGESFTHYVHRIRINKSIELMQTDSLEHLQEIAYQVGYNHYAVYIKYFKQYMEMTPNDYLKHIKK